MEGKLRRMAGLTLAAKGELRAAERTEFRRLCALLGVMPEQVWQGLGGDTLARDHGFMARTRDKNYILSPDTVIYRALHLQYPDLSCCQEIGRI